MIIHSTQRRKIQILLYAQPGGALRLTTMPKPKKLTHKEVENLFLDIWYKEIPETYNSLWYEGIEGEQLISDCAEVYPHLYKNLLKRLEEEAKKRNLILP